MEVGMKDVSQIKVPAVWLLVHGAVILEWVTTGEHSLFMVLSVIVIVKVLHQLQLHLLAHKFNKMFMNVGCVVVVGLFLMAMVDKVQWEPFVVVDLVVVKVELVVLALLKLASYNYNNINTFKVKPSFIDINPWHKFQ
jgi:hypothetical protein